MKKGTISEGMIEKVEFPNKGTIRTEDGEKVIVKNGVPYQKVRFFVQKKRKGKCEGRLLEVLEKSPLELPQAACVHFGSCGGCTYQNLDYSNQLQLKKEQVEQLLFPVVQAEDPTWFEGIKPSPVQFGYRNKMEFSFGDAYKDGPLALGMHKKGSFYDLVTVDQCIIADSDFNKILKAVLSYFTKEETSYFKKRTHIGYLRHLLVRKAAKTGEILAVLVTTTQDCGSKPEQALLEDFKNTLLSLDLQGKITGILHTKNDSVADAVKNEGTDILYGTDYFYEALLGLKFKISAFSFFQTNSLGAEVLYDTVRQFAKDAVLGHDGILYDLYSGTGTIAQMMAMAAKKVIGVEIIEEAVLAARENARCNGLDNCEFIAGDVLKVLDTIPEKPDVIILDPPREGVHPKALGKILDYGVDNIVYISCKPTSLVRDLEVMQERGYRVVRGCCVDMFPGTYHVETVVMLSHKKPDSVINVKVEFGEGEGKVPLDNIAKRAAAYKPKERVTYKMIKEYIEAKYGFKVHTAYIAEVKRDLGLPMYDAPNAVEELKQPRKHPTAEKVEAIKDALKHFEVICS